MELGHLKGQVEFVSAKLKPSMDDDGFSAAKKVICKTPDIFDVKVAKGPKYMGWVRPRAVLYDACLDTPTVPWICSAPQSPPRRE